MIILIFGASGSGKTTLLQEIQRSDPLASIHTKGTDRQPKRYDSDEIRCVEAISSAQYDYIYQQYGHRYGIQRTQIDIALEAERDHFIICNDIPTLRSIKQDYGDIVRTVFLLFNAPREYIERVQRTRGITDDDVDLRLAKISVLSEIFLDNSELFDGVIINKLGAPASEMVNQLNLILDRVSPTSELSRARPRSVAAIGEIVSVIKQNLLNYIMETGPVTQKGYVFVLMAMIQNDHLLEDTHNAIKRASLSCGLHAERVDDIAFTEQITDKVLGSIRCAEFIVADITHQRPNVYYEIGYAHAHLRPTILIAREGTKPHFDIQGYPIIYYKSATELEKDLVNFYERYQGSAE
jgi:guanylate kinase